MKKALAIVLLALVAMLGASAQNKVSSQVMYTLGPDEELWDSEYIMPVKASATKYSVMVYNTITKTVTFVLNGQKIVTGDYVNVAYLDLDNKDKCIYSWKEAGSAGNEESYYIHIPEGTFGPYEAAYSILSSAWFANPTMPEWMFRNCFLFYQYNRWNVYRDGSIVSFPVQGDFSMAFDGILASPISPNGKHHAYFNDGNIMVDGKVFNTSLIAGDNASSLSVFSLDNGLAYVRYYNYGTQELVLNPANGELTRIERGKNYFDFNTLSVKEGNYYEPDFFQYAHNRSELSNAKGDHFLSINYNNEGKVEIDGAEANGQYPFFTGFDESSNSFVWICLEGKNIVRYTCKMK